MFLLAGLFRKSPLSLVRLRPPFYLLRGARCPSTARCIFVRQATRTRPTRSERHLRIPLCKCPLRESRIFRCRVSFHARICLCKLVHSVFATHHHLKTCRFGSPHDTLSRQVLALRLCRYVRPIQNLPRRRHPQATPPFRAPVSARYASSLRTSSHHRDVVIQTPRACCPSNSLRIFRPS